MIFDSVKNLRNYCKLSPEAWELIAENVAMLDENTPTGKTVLIPEKLFVLIQRYASRKIDEVVTLETHNEFADLQLLISGKEVIYYAATAAAQCTSPYDEKNDYALYSIDKSQTIPLKMQAGDFAVFLPQEGHMPGTGDGESVVKAVIKIHRTLLD